MEYLQIAEEFAKIIWSHKSKLEIDDIMLFGSLAYNKPNPKDIDLLILYHNQVLTEFQKISKSKEILDINKLYILSEKMKDRINLLRLIKETEIEKIVCLGKFNAQYMNIDFFTKEDYKRQWLDDDKKFHHNPKQRLEGENFEDTIFRQGLLWNPVTSKYDIPTRSKYNIPKSKTITV